MSKTTAEEIKDRLARANDRSYYDSIYEQMRRAFGCVGEGGTVGGGTFRDYADVRPNFKEIGTSNRILNSSLIILSRVCRSDPEPEFPQVHRMVSEVRKQFFLQRSKGSGYADGDWMTQHEGVFLDGDNLGRGVAKVGLVTNPKTGKKRVDIKHVPILQVLRDRNERSLGRARWICFMDYVPVDKAEAFFGKEAVANKIHEMHDPGSASSIKCVRVFEYYDLGVGKKEPTMAYILGDITEDPWKVMPNPFECLPFAYYEHVLLPGMQDPQGRVSLLTADQEAINEAERRERAEMNRPGFDLVDATLLDSNDLALVEGGEPGVVVKMLRQLQPGEQPFTRVPGGEISQTTLASMERLERDFNANAGVNDFDRGNLSEQKRTLGENQLLDERSKVQSNRSVLQLTKYYIRLVEKVLHIASLGDDDPLVVDIDHQNLPLNVEGQPGSMIGQWCQEPSVIVIDEESLLKSDLARDRAQKIAEVSALLPIAPLLPPEWIRDEMLNAAGFDPSEVMQAAQTAAGGQGGADPNQQGQDGQQTDIEDLRVKIYQYAPPTVQEQIEQSLGLQPAGIHERKQTLETADKVVSHAMSMQQADRTQANTEAAAKQQAIDSKRAANKPKPKGK